MLVEHSEGVLPKAFSMAQAAKRKIVVAGGNGFLGSRICKSAAARGWDVVSIRYLLIFNEGRWAQLILEQSLR